MIIKLIVSISLTLLFLFLLFLLLHKHQKLKKLISTYEIFNVARNSNVIISIVFLVFSFFLLIASIVVSFYDENIAYFAVTSLGVFFSSLSLLLSCVVSLNALAYKSGKIYVIKVFKTKEIDVKKVYYFSYFNNLARVCLDKKQEVLFEFLSLKDERLLNKIKEDHIIIDLTKIAPVPEEFKESLSLLDIEKYERFGKEIRSQKEKIIKSSKFSFLFTMIFSIALSICIGILVEPVFFALAILFLAISIMTYSTRKKTIEKNYDFDDFNLGIRYFTTCKSYIGHHKKVFKSIRVLTIVLFIISASIGSFTLVWVSDFTPTDYSTLQEINGTLKYGIEEDSYIALGIYGSDIEYRLTSIYKDEFNYSFFDDVVIGDNVTLYASKTTINGNNTNTGEDCKLANIYYVKSNGLEYFGYNQMLKAEVDNYNIALAMSIVFCSISVLSLVGLVSGYLYYKKNEKLEKYSV